MERSFSTTVTGWFFVLGAMMLWFGWALSPAHIGSNFKAEDFSAVGAHLESWIWLFRIHLFGYIVVVMAFTALASLFADRPARILLWPGNAAAISGLIVSTVAAAFYYHFGASGALFLQGQSAEVAQQYADSLWVVTEYVHCLVRFGRVFLGLGLVIMAWGLMKWKVLPLWMVLWMAALGVAAMALTMLFENLELYMTLFHLNALWFLTTGLYIVRFGIQYHDDERRPLTTIMPPQEKVA